jgi:F-type H+-transporting ATPase subunit c
MRIYLINAVLFLSSYVWASDGDVGMAKISAALAISLGIFGVALGQGKAASAALEGIARNPSCRSDVFVPLVLSLAFMELLGLLCFVIALNLAS